ncbi:MAG: squalene/phytoene synthase family protein [Roseivirga sp.]|nr:squalene/phytoene synthase family protein [Roseivirga sp.]
MRDYLRREAFIMRCFAALLKRNFKKYFTVGGITYWLGASGIYPAAKPTYFFCRYVDDLADGDRQLPDCYADFSDFTVRMKQLVEQPETKDLRDIELVLADAIKKLTRKSANTQVVKKELVAFLDSMLIDYDRRIHSSILSQQELDQLYDSSFSSVLQLTFIGTGTVLPREYITQLGLIQGKLYALQDLHEDLTAGIINLPGELITDIGLSLELLTKAPHCLQKHEAFDQWRSAELMLCYEYLQTLQSLEVDRKVRKIISILTDPLEVYLKEEMTLISESGLQLS